MSGPAVVFESVSKKFRRGERHDTLRDLLPSMIRGLARPQQERLATDEFWALRGVTFTVDPGQALGIIGPNGAGKSTTLKVLTRILRPTLGRCVVVGRIGAMIEVAAGFHPDLTGRENVYLQGAIMGMKRAEIAARFDEIVDFAGISAFLDTPVKRYSSGMNARLGFAIAAHLNPQVLIIDEVLSVGDMAFQQKCVERMKEYKRQGVAIVFVTHNLQAVSYLCDNALHLQSELRAYGPVDEVLRAYIRGVNDAVGHSYDGRIEIVDPVLHENGAAIDEIEPGKRLTLEATYVVHETVEDVHFQFNVYRSTDNLVVYGGNFQLEDVGIQRLTAGERVRIAFSFVVHLRRGQYHIEVNAVENSKSIYLARLNPAGLLNVVENRTDQGVANLDVSAHVRQSPLEMTAVGPSPR